MEKTPQELYAVTTRTFDVYKALRHLPAGTPAREAAWADYERARDAFCAAKKPATPNYWPARRRKGR